MTFLTLLRVSRHFYVFDTIHEILIPALTTVCLFSVDLKYLPSVYVFCSMGIPYLETIVLNKQFLSFKKLNKHNIVTNLNNLE